MTKHKHDHESEPRVHLGREYVRLNSEKYEWKDDDYSDTKWYRVSKNSVLLNGKKVAFVAEKDRGQRDDGSPDDTVWEDVRYRVKDRKLIRKLDRLLDHAEKKKERQDQEKERRREAKRLKHVQKAVRALDEAAYLPDENSSSSDSSSSSAEETPVELTPWQKREKQGPPAKGKKVERTKYGVRVFSNDGKTYWDICVNNSTKYRGTAVRVTLPPPRKDGSRWNMAVFDLEAMEAIRREFARGQQKERS